MSDSSSNTTNNPIHPSLVGGHARYVKGAAEAAIGTVTGSEAWTRAGLQDKEAGIEVMKTASENRDAEQTGFGKVEEVAGKAVGCEGMEKEGAESQSK